MHILTCPALPCPVVRPHICTPDVETKVKENMLLSAGGQWLPFHEVLGSSEDGLPLDWDTTAPGGLPGRSLPPT